MKQRTPAEVLELVDDEGVEFVDYRFCDLPGIMQHVTVPASALEESTFEDGHGFDGSSIRGFQQIQESDMILLPDAATAYIDPFRARKTLILHTYVADPLTLKNYTRDPRYVARKAERYLTESGIATTSFWGPEIEFYIFDSLRFETAGHKSMYEIDSDEGVVAFVAKNPTAVGYVSGTAKLVGVRELAIH